MCFDTMIEHTQVTHVLSDDLTDEECQYVWPRSVEFEQVIIQGGLKIVTLIS